MVFRQRADLSSSAPASGGVAFVLRSVRENTLKRGEAMGGHEHRAHSARYGARHPMLAPWPNLAAYLVWRAFIITIRPAIFLGLLIGGGWLLVTAGQSAQTGQRLSAPPSVQIETAFKAAAPDRTSRQHIWLDGMYDALDVGPRAAPDLGLAESYAEAAILIEGREQLALQLLSQTRRAAMVEAELRGRPALERAAMLDDAIERVLEAGRDRGLHPPTLILAPERLRLRLERARRLYGPALDGAAGWFIDPGARALALASLPGSPAEAAVLYGDSRDVLVQGCAMAQAAGRQVGQCRVGFLPKPDADPVLTGLAVAVIGADEADRPGARIVKAAYAAGMLDPRFAERLAFGADPVLGREAVLTALMPVLGEAGQAWTQPVRYGERLKEASTEAAASVERDAGTRRRVFQALAAVSRDAGALAAIRLASTIGAVHEAERLAMLAEIDGARLLALHHLAPEALDRLVRDESDRDSALGDWSRQDRITAIIGAGLVASAFALFFISLIAGVLQARTGRPGWLARLDGAATRLMLGKNF